MCVWWITILLEKSLRGGICSWLTGRRLVFFFLCKMFNTQLASMTQYVHYYNIIVKTCVGVCLIYEYVLIHWPCKNQSNRYMTEKDQIEYYRNRELIMNCSQGVGWTSRKVEINRTCVSTKILNKQFKII